MRKCALALLILFFCALPTVLASSEVFTVSHVSDGDTLTLEDGRKVRLIGVDTPEMSDESRNRRNAVRFHLNANTVHNFAWKARQFVLDQVQGKKVRLEYDRQREDKYGRTLAYVYREPDDFFLNAELVRQGYGFDYRAFPFRYSDDFYRYEQEARDKKKGLWD